MSINFFNNQCKTNSNKKRFGLCDDPPPSDRSAYIDENNSKKWITEVENDYEKLVEFYGIDRCVDIRRPDGSQAQRCDGMLHFGKILFFVELKDRKGRGWPTNGFDQLLATVKHFQSEYDIREYSEVKVFLCNKQMYRSPQNHHILKQRFRDETGLSFTIKKTIKI